MQSIAIHHYSLAWNAAMMENNEVLMGPNPLHLSSFPWLLTPRIPPHRGVRP